MDGETTNTSTKAPKKKTTYLDVQSEAQKPVCERSRVTSNRGNQVVPRRYEMLLEKAEAKKAERTALGRAFINPHPTGMYKAITETLGSAGVNQWHTYVVLRDGVQAILSEENTKNEAGETSWDRFEKKDHAPNMPDNHKDIRGRLEQNAKVLQRVTMFKMEKVNEEDKKSPLVLDANGKPILVFDANGQPIVIAGGQNPYGDRLRQFCQSIDIRLVEKYGEMVLEFMLNTEWEIPEIVRPLKPNIRQLRAEKNAAEKAKIKKTVKKSKKSKKSKKVNEPVEQELVAETPAIKEPVAGKESDTTKSDADVVATAFSEDEDFRDEPSDEVLANILVDEALADASSIDEDNQAVA